MKQILFEYQIVSLNLKGAIKASSMASARLILVRRYKVSFSETRLIEAFNALTEEY